MLADSVRETCRTLQDHTLIQSGGSFANRGCTTVAEYICNDLAQQRYYSRIFSGRKDIPDVKKLWVYDVERGPAGGIKIPDSKDTSVQNDFYQFHVAVGFTTSDEGTLVFDPLNYDDVLSKDEWLNGFVTESGGKLGLLETDRFPLNMKEAFNYSEHTKKWFWERFGREIEYKMDRWDMASHSGDPSPNSKFEPYNH